MRSKTSTKPDSRALTAVAKQAVNSAREALAAYEMNERINGHPIVILALLIAAEALDTISKGSPMKKPSFNKLLKATRRWSKATANAAHVARKAANVANQAAGNACRHAFKANTAARRAALLVQNAENQVTHLELEKKKADRMKIDALRAAKAARARIKRAKIKRDKNRAQMEQSQNRLRPDAIKRTRPRQSGKNQP